MITIEESAVSGFFKVDGVDYQQNQYVIEYDNIAATLDKRNFSLVNINGGRAIISSRGFAEIEGVGSWSDLYALLNKVGALKNKDVMLTDQTTSPVIGYFNKVVAYSTITDDLAVDAKTLTVTSITGFVVGQYLQIYSPIEARYYLGNIVSINGNVITVDSPFDYAFLAGSYAIGTIKNLNVNGSVTPQIFALRQAGLGLGDLNVDFDITRIIFTCQTTNTVDLSKFGDIAGGLVNGILLRRKDGVIRNIFNAKTNAELSNLMFDFVIQAATNPQQGRNGFVGRLTFSGQEKMGVALRIKAGEDLQFIIQDDLSTLISFNAIAEGHEVIY